MSDILSRPGPPPDRTIPYGPHADQVIDLWLPPATSRGWVAYLHGGFWRPEYDRSHARPLAAALAATGLTVALPEYRRTGWPEIFDDVHHAMNAFTALAEGPTLWSGHSAGGHLALWAAARHRLPRASAWFHPSPRAPVVALAGCCSLERCAAWHLGADAAVALLGGIPADVPERYALADPGALLPLGVPITLVHGTDDDRVPVAMSREFGADATARGDAVRLVEITGADHFDLIDPLSPAWPQVAAALTP
ncbi:alpha/beta hydrolase [Streptosporangiaceae bacterium NEAU-GS5]|nr:alpha/beta hydrolase [Streptosporangiaceae bacterium NEAU-GS5]